MIKPKLNYEDFKIIDKALVEYSQQLYDFISTPSVYAEIVRVDDLLDKIRTIKTIIRSREHLED